MGAKMTVCSVAMLFELVMVHSNVERKMVIETR